MEIVPVAGSTMAPCTKAVCAELASLHGPAAGSVAVSWYGVASPRIHDSTDQSVWESFVATQGNRLGHDMTDPGPAPEVPAGQTMAGSLKELKTRFEYQEFGGGPLLGIRGACIICHGSSGDRAIKNALRVAETMADEKLNQSIVEKLAAVPGGSAGG